MIDSKKIQIVLFVLLTIFSTFYFSRFNFCLALDSLSMSCTMGGPYLPDSTVIISGNVTNSTGDSQVANVKISINTTEKTTTSDSNGSFYVSYGNAQVGNYSVIGMANLTDFDNATCSELFTVYNPAATLACRMKTVVFQGTAIDSGSGNVITSGNVTSIIAETNSTGSAVIQNNGAFSVSIRGCLKYGTRYLVTNIFDDSQGRRGWFSFIYVPT
ncbi:MAG: carboxypeptidase-like regulatory domain-containing protein [Candidatus Aenigmatarchaeota archaeon]